MNNRSELMHFSVIIPAAGNSGRMGSDKALLAYGHGETFAGHLVKGYSELGARPVVLIENENQEKNDFGNDQLIRVMNKHVEYGRSYSIWLGLQQVPQGCACFIQNIDNPFFETALLEQMTALSENEGFVVPECNGRGGHPVLLGQNVVSHIQGMNDLKDFREVLKKFRRIVLPYQDERILWNINTPAEYERFLKTGKSNEI